MIALAGAPWRVAAAREPALRVELFVIIQHEVWKAREAHAGPGTPWLVSLVAASFLAWFIVGMQRRRGRGVIQMRSGPRRVAGARGRGRAAGEPIGRATRSGA